MVGRFAVFGPSPAGTPATGGDQPVEVGRAARPVPPDPFFDELTDQPERWWKRPAVTRSGIALGVLATVILTFVILPETPEQSDGTWRPALLPTVGSGVSIVTSATPPAPELSSPAATVSPAAPSQAVATRQPSTPAASPSSTRRSQPGNSPSARPSPTRTQSAPRTAELTPLPPSRERDLRSTHNDRPTSIEFVNRRKEPVIVYWLDHRGRRVPYRILMPGQSYRQPTYVTHPWVVTRMDGRALAIFLPDRNPARATIT